MSNVQNVRTLEMGPASKGPQSLRFIRFPRAPQLELNLDIKSQDQGRWDQRDLSFSPGLSHSLPSWNLDLIICKMSILTASIFGSLLGIL